jgi:hypothetical protein
MGNGESDLAQAITLLAALQQNIIAATDSIKKLEQQRPPGSFAGPRERMLRREVSELHGYVDRICERFLQTRPLPFQEDVASLP